MRKIFSFLLFMTMVASARGVERTPLIYQKESKKLINSYPIYPAQQFSGRGIVIAAGGDLYLTNAVVGLKILRHLNCTLPVEIWYIGEEEINDRWRELFTKLGASCHDITEKFNFPIRSYMVKPLSLIASSFEEVILIDADNTALRDPSFLFEDPRYNERGALFWPDLYVLQEDNIVWNILGLPKQQITAQESGQLVINKRICWRPLQLTLYMNQHSSFFYHILLGDKDTFFLAWKAAGQPFHMNSYFPGLGLTAESLFFLEKYPDRSMHFAGFLQRDFEGEPLFYHMIHDKWNALGDYEFRTTHFWLPTHELEFPHIYALRESKYRTPHDKLAHRAKEHLFFSLEENFSFIEEIGYEALGEILSSGALKPPKALQPKKRDS